MTKSQARAKVNEAISWHQSTHMVGVIALLVLFGTSLLHINLSVDAGKGAGFLVFLGWCLSILLIVVYSVFAITQLQRNETTQLIDDAISEHIKTLPEKEEAPSQ